MIFILASQWESVSWQIETGERRPRTPLLGRNIQER